jgi:hypothetical protein
VKVVVPLWKRTDIQLLFKHLDPNSDGDISAEELQLAFRNLHGAAHNEQLMHDAGPVILRLVQYLADNRLTVRDLFRLIDTDRSNSISCAELKTILLRMPKVGLIGLAGNGEDEDESSIGSVGSNSLVSFGNSSVSNSMTMSMSESLAASITSATSDFRSPFKYESGSRAIRGAAAFGKQNKNVLESKCYDLEKMQLKSSLQEKEKARRNKAKGGPPSPSLIPPLITHSVAEMSAITTTSESLKVTVKNSAARTGRPGNTFPLASPLLQPGNSSATNNAEKQAYNSASEAAVATASRERKVLLDPRHAKGIVHYSSVWNRQYKLLDFGK